MKLIFICGSLTEGKNGVGDYTRALATELQEAGHDCLLLSVNDELSASEARGRLRLERRQAGLQSPRIQTELLQLIQSWQADWISLQFVPYAYDPYGLVGSLRTWIAKVRKHAKLHILFHELWIQSQRGLRLKQHVLARVQKHLLIRAIRDWNPDRIDTTIPKYQEQLQQAGFVAALLPIFGNIPIQPIPGQNSKDASTDGPIPYAPYAPSDQRVIIFPFSQSKEWEGVHFVEELCRLAEQASHTLKIVQVGRSRAFDTHWPAIRESVERRGWPCELLGEISAADISRELHLADVGASPANLDLAMKSGGVVSMLEHGLPVICSGVAPSKLLQRKGDESQLFDWHTQRQDILDLLSNPRKTKPRSHRSMVAQEFLRHLQ